MPCSQGILYIASRKQKCTHVFTKELEVLNGKVSSPKHIIHCYKCHVFNNVYFSLKYCKYLFPVFFFGHFGRGVGHKNFLCPHPPHFRFLRCSSARNKVVWIIIKSGLCVAKLQHLQYKADCTCTVSCSWANLLARWGKLGSYGPTLRTCSIRWRDTNYRMLLTLKICE